MSGYVSGPASCPPSICADVSAYWNICCLLLTDHLLAELMKCSRCWDNPALDCQWHHKHFLLGFHFYLCSGMAAPGRHGLPCPCHVLTLAAFHRIQVAGFGVNVEGWSGTYVHVVAVINCCHCKLRSKGRSGFAGRKMCMGRACGPWLAQHRSAVSLMLCRAADLFLGLSKSNFSLHPESLAL